MCKRHAHPIDSLAPAAQGAYEGKTMRLDGQKLLRAERHSTHGERAGHRWPAGFPWPALWLIWPLILLITWLAPVTQGLIAAVFQGLGALAATPASLAAIVLIAIGLVLISRR
jgi:hypothetical protein